MNQPKCDPLSALCLVTLVSGALAAVGPGVRAADLDRLDIEAGTNGQVVVTWSTNAVLQSSPDLETWFDLREADSPHTNGAAEPTEGFRLRLPDYTLFGNLSNRTDVALVDYDKNLVHMWEGDLPYSLSVYLFDDGSILRAASLSNEAFPAPGSGGRIEKRDWDSNLLWSFDYSSPTYCQHHDIEPMPNGNVLVVAWEKVTLEEAVANGRDPSLVGSNELSAVWPDTIVEIRPTGPQSGEVVWKWSPMDHLIQDFDETKANFGVVGDHPELIDFNYAARTNPDWHHVNAVTYHPGLDQIMISANLFNEIWIIDHSTTTEEAASHAGGTYGKGGDLLYRWGNPEAYRAGDADDRVLDSHHQPTWIPAGYPGEGNILIFNNGRNHRMYSSVDEITPPLLPDGTYALTPGEAYGPPTLTWTYVADPPEKFFSPFISGAQRLPDGNTLICSGPQRTFFEVTPGGTIRWQYQPPLSPAGIFRATRVFFDLPQP